MEKRFGNPHLSFLREKALELRELPTVLSYSYRYDAGHGLAISFPMLFPFFFFGIPVPCELPLAGGWFLPRFYGLAGEGGDGFYGVQMLYTPSTSRWIETYMAVNGELRLSNPDQEPDKLQFDFYPVAETGLRIRLINPNWWGLFRFFGLRIGIRTDVELDRVHGTRFIFEMGTGAF